MLRTIIAVLVSLPLLMPPGMCICQFGPDQCCAAASEEENASQPHAAPRKHACCRHSRRTEESSTQPTTRKVNRIRVADHAFLCGHDHSTPLDRHHFPGCPALKPADHSRVSEPISIRLLPLDTACGFCHTLEASHSPRGHSPSFTVIEPDHPLYLTFCTLLI
jgi:hypothetical protein